MTDFQHREGSTGSAGIAGSSEANVDRRERLRRLALESINLANDPYLMKNHLGSYECKLCLTLHNNEGSYLAHTQGKKHQANLGRRAAREAAEKLGSSTNLLVSATGKPTPIKKVMLKIGRPGYKITKIRERDENSTFGGKYGLLIQIHYPQIGHEIYPLHRFMSAFEQRVEIPDRRWQYLVVAAEPYETIAFRIPSKEIELSPDRFLQHWDPDAKQYTLQFFFRSEVF
jgi:splicing factor 3A subunit 2